MGCSSAQDKQGKKQGDELMTELVKHLAILMADRFTGYVRINFSQGAVARVEKYEELRIGDFAGVKGTYRKP